MTITWHRNTDGTSRTVIEPAVSVRNPTAYRIVDRTDPLAVAEWNTGVAPVEDAVECDECPPGRPCWCTAESVDPIRY